MADLVKAIITTEFKGQAGLNQAAAAIGKTEVALKKLTPGANQANFALTNLGRVAQDAPFGFIGIANNIDPLIQSFQQLRKESGSTGAALKALGASLLGGGGLILGISLVTSALTFFSMQSRKSKEDTERKTKAIDEAAQKQKEFENAINAASSAVVNQSNKLTDLKGILISTGEQLGELSKQTINQAVTQYLFTQKRELLEKLIGEKLKQQLDTGEKLLKNYKNFQLTGNEAFGRETEVSLERINRLAKVLGVTFNDVFNSTFNKAKPDKLEVKPKKVVIDFNQDVTDKQVENLIKYMFDKSVKFDFVAPILIPPDEAKRQATEFNDIFFKEVSQYTGKTKIDLGLDKAVADAKAKEAFNKAIQSTFEEGFNNLRIEGLSGLAESIGSVFSGGDLKNVFSNFLSILGSGIQAIGKQVIALGVTAKAVKAALKTIFVNPAAALIAGVGLVAVGAAIKGIASKGIAGARALGGPVGAGRSYIVGENGPELFTPGVSGNIIPNGRLGGVSNSFGGMQVQGVLTGRGNDLVAIISAAGRSNGRLG